MIKHKHLLLTICLFLCCIIQPGIILHAGTIEKKITAFDRAEGDEFGCSVAISDNFAVIGAYKDDYLPEEPTGYTEARENSGSVYVYKRNGMNWELQQKIIPNDPKQWMYFGTSVAIDNDYIAVGAYQENGDERSSPQASELTRSGAAYIYKYNGEKWIQEARLIPDDAGPEDKFGFRVDLSGNYVIVGCNAKKPIGAAYIFKNNQGNWSQQQMLTSENDGTFERFGYTVSISGDYACVGADKGVNNDINSGTVYLFKREDERWIHEKRLFDKNGDYNDAFGRSVSISGDYIVIGAPSHDGCGKTSGMAYYSVKNETGWSEPIKISGDDGHVAGIKFGRSVSISENCAIIGASVGNGYSEKSGSVFTFAIQDKKLIKSKILLANDGKASDYFGTGVAVHGKHLIIGAPGKEYPQKFGAAYIFSEIEPKYGDFNNDNFIDIIDAIIVLKKLSLSDK